MVHVTEVRIVMPFTVEEFKRGQRYANWKTNENATEPGQGGQLLNSTPYFHEVYGEGMFTHSLYRFGNRLPDWVNRLVPPSALVVDEKSWITYPYMRTVITIPFFSKLKMEVESVHLNDDGSTENALGLSEEMLQIRKIDYMDLGSEKVAPRDYQKELDPLTVKPKSTGRGPLTPGWQQREKTLMCAYKVIKADVNYWGLGTRAEILLINSLRQIFLLAHKNCFGLTDEWYHLNYEEVIALEVASHERLNLAKATVLGHEAAEVALEGPEEGGGAAAAAVSEGSDGKLERVEDREQSPASVLDGGENVEDFDVEFHEAEMQWSLEEEQYAEQLLSEGFGSMRNTLPSPQHLHPEALGQGALPVPAQCPVCAAGSLPASAPGDSTSPPTLFCSTCSEFFCQRCFGTLHCTDRLRRHMTTPLTGASRRYMSSDSSLSSTTPNLEGGAEPGADVQEKDLVKKEREARQRERKRAEQQRKEEEKARKEAARRVRQEKGKEKEEMRERAKEIQREDQQMEREMRQAKKEIVKAQKTLSSHKGEEGEGSDSSLPDQLSSMKYPPLNLDALPLLSQPGRRTRRGDMPREDSDGPGPLAAASHSEDATGSVLSPVPGAAAAVGLDAGESAGPGGPETPTEEVPSLHASLSQESLERLEDDFSGRPVELSEAALSLMLVLYRASREEGSSSATAQVASASSSRRFSSFSFRRSFQAPATGSPAYGPPSGASQLEYTLSHSSSTADLAEVPPSLASPLPGSTADLVRLGSQPQEVVQEAIEKLNVARASEDGANREGAAGSVVDADTPSLRVQDGTFVAVEAAALESVARGALGKNRKILLKFRALVELLNYVEPQVLTHEEKLVFWINIYNMLALHGYLIYGIPKSQYKRVMFLNKVSYFIGGSNFSLLTIEHSVLRAASHRPALAGLLPVQRFKPSDPAFLCALERPEPLLTFTLSCGSASSPPVQVYNLAHVREQLKEATSRYLEQGVDLGSRTKIALPKLLQWYGKDFAPTTAKLLQWICSNLPEPKKAELVSRLKRKAKKGEESVDWQDAAKNVQIISYDWSFKYLLGVPTVALE